MTAAESVHVPLLDLAPLHAELQHELESAVARVIGSGEFVLGSALRAFERDAAAYLGVRHAIGVASGTDALLLALKAAGIGAGDEVVTTSFTFFATAEAIVHAGATPAFADIDPGSLCIDPDDLARRITTRTRAILPVHLFGGVADMTAIERIASEHGLAVIEDAAQAFGARRDGRFAGTSGLAGCFSFHPSKTLGALGDGGMIVTNDDAFAARVRRLRNHGGEIRHRHEEFGYNSRLDDIQAAVLGVKLRHLEAHLEARVRSAERYFEMLAALPLQLPQRPPGVQHVFAPFTVRTPHRDSVHAALTGAGVGSAIHYPSPVYAQPAFTGTRVLCLPAAEAAAASCLSLPLFHGILEEQQRRVAQALEAALREQ